MSHFATALNELLEEKKLTQAELSRLSGIVQPQISRWINIPNQWISEEDFERLCRVFTKPIEQANLVRARLLDIVSATDVPGTKLVDITVSGESTHEQSARYHTKLPPKIDKDIQTVIEHITSDRLVRDMIASLAVHLRRKQ